MRGKRFEWLIVLGLIVLSLTGIIFIINLRKEPSSEELPKEGTQIINKAPSEESTSEEKENTTEEKENTTEEENTSEEKENTSSEIVSSEEETKVPIGKITDADLNIPIYEYENYIDYVNANGSNSESIFMFHDDAKIVDELIIQDVENNGVVKETVRGIKVGDSLDKLIETYGVADSYDTYNRDLFSYGDKKDLYQYIYFFKTESSKDFFYSFRFIVDQNNEVLGLILEPLKMEWWTYD